MKNSNFYTSYPATKTYIDEESLLNNMTKALKGFLWSTQKTFDVVFCNPTSFNSDQIRILYDKRVPICISEPSDSYLNNFNEDHFEYAKVIILTTSPEWSTVNGAIRKLFFTLDINKKINIIYRQTQGDVEFKINSEKLLLGKVTLLCQDKIPPEDGDKLDDLFPFEDYLLKLSENFGKIKIHTVEEYNDENTELLKKSFGSPQEIYHRKIVTAPRKEERRKIETQKFKEKCLDRPRSKSDSGWVRKETLLDFEYHHGQNNENKEDDENLKEKQIWLDFYHQTNFDGSEEHYSQEFSERSDSEPSINEEDSHG